MLLAYHGGLKSYLAVIKGLPCLQIIEDAAVHENYCRVITPEPAINEETEDVCALLKQCLDLRCICA